MLIYLVTYPNACIEITEYFQKMLYYIVSSRVNPPYKIKNFQFLPKMIFAEAFSKVTSPSPPTDPNFLKHLIDSKTSNYDERAWIKLEF